jgi:hypothetical protein
MALPASSIQNEILLLHPLALPTHDYLPQTLRSNCFAHCASRWILGNLKLHIQTLRPVLPALHACQAQVATPCVRIIDVRTSHRLHGHRAEDRAIRETCKVIVAPPPLVESANMLHRILDASRAWLASFPYYCQWECGRRCHWTQWKWIQKRGNEQRTTRTATSCRH